MGRLNWDKSLEELCSSPEEVQKLKEVASLLCRLPKVSSSSSFQAELKARLMEKALTEEESSAAERKWHGFMRGGFKFGGKMRLPSVAFAAAAVFFLIISLTTFYRQGDLRFNAIWEAPQKKMTGIITGQHSNLESSLQEQYLAPQQSQESPPVENGTITEVHPKESLSETTIPSGFLPSDNTPEETLAGERPEVEGRTEEKEESGPLRMDPDFEALKNQQSFRLAGEIKLPPVYYGAEEQRVQAGSVSCSWSPRKIVFSADPGEAGIFGTQAWAKETLSNTGFIVREGDHLQVDLHKTQEGLFAELFYRPQKSESIPLTLVIHCREGAGIISHYYKEEGEAANPGYYPLLSPAEAFKQVETLKWFTASSRLNFSFQEVVLTYGDFLLEQNGQQKTVKLPAYRFLGMETISGGGEITLVLPAVK